MLVVHVLTGDCMERITHKTVEIKKTKCVICRKLISKNDHSYVFQLIGIGNYFTLTSWNVTLGI